MSEAAKETAQREAILMAKITELKGRIVVPKPNDNRYVRQQFTNSLDWYTSARRLAKEESLNHDDRMILQEQMQAIQDHGQSFEGLDAEFNSFDDDEVKRIRQSLFVF